MPDFQSVVRKRLASLNLHASEEATLSDELTQHLEDRYRELLSGGAGETAAYNSAVSQLDDLHSLRAVRRLPKHDPVPAGDLRRGSVLEDLSRDLRYAGRTMRKSPLFVLVVVLTLGFGIGANTTVFTVLNTLLINPLPVRNSSELASVGLAPAGSESKPSPPQPPPTSTRRIQMETRFALRRPHLVAHRHLPASWFARAHVYRVRHRRLFRCSGFRPAADASSLPKKTPWGDTPSPFSTTCHGAPLGPDIVGRPSCSTTCLSP